MKSMGSEINNEVTQISIGGFDDSVTAEMLSNYLEETIGTVWRCRLKTSSTPIDSYPDFVINTANLRRMNDCANVIPHAFVHFAHPDSAKEALDFANHGKLMLNERPLKVSLGPKNPYCMNQRRRTIDPFKFSDCNVEVGVLVNRDEFVVSWRGPSNGVDFLVDPFDGKCKLLFRKDTAFTSEDDIDLAVANCDFKIEFTLREINEIKKGMDMSGLIVILQLASSPLLYYRTAGDDFEESVTFDLLDDDDPWIRTTDFTPSGAIGRCNTYRIYILPRHCIKLGRALQYLKEQRVQISDNAPLQRLSKFDEPCFNSFMSDPFFCIQNKEGISFKVLFLVNAAMHKGIINQHQLSENFFDLLRTQPEDVNMAALKHICSDKQPSIDACGRLKLVHEWLLKNPKLFEKSMNENDIVEVRRLLITPSKAYCLPPEVELSNRVLRNYKEVGDRFLRVTFMDEGMRTLNNNVLNYYPASIVWDLKKRFNSQKTRMFKRIKDILSDGFYLCGRKYSFLAFSANQLRDRSAWFFAEDRNTKVSHIIEWMGKFSDKNVAKCAARMGQCFSSTYATVEVPHDKVKFDHPDIKKNIYVFSDGIGIISPDLAAEVAARLKLNVNQPCAYQIRYAGAKGVVACWPTSLCGTNNGSHLCLRPSMIKFESNHPILEICSWTRFQPGFLNRQIVTLLSALGVPDEIFWKMQESMIVRLNQMLVDVDVAFDILTTSCAEQGSTAAIMLSAGFRPQTEPHLRGMLTSVRAAQLGDLREKSRIFVPSGRWLMGCLDELGVLEHGQCFIQVSNLSLENCFVQHGSKFSETKKNLQVVKGLVAVAKNPCLHPGDVRILEAVDAPELHHLYDCLVFPQKGERPHTNEASGSDLDGDLYFVTWDENLIPPSKRSWSPMEYAPVKAKLQRYPISRKDIINFFTTSIVNESLGAICNGHVVHADMSDYGALDEKCIKLAELAATAVDFPKTGKLVKMPFDLKPKLYPDFMGKEAFQSYKSNKILGKLYRKIIDAFGEDVLESGPWNPPEISYDPDLEVEGSNTFIDRAWNWKCSYDGQLHGLLGQYKVHKEEELVTGHIWSMPKYASRKQGELKERLKHAYSALRKEFRKVFENLDLDSDQLSDEEKNALYEKKASAWYQVTYHPYWMKRTRASLELDGNSEALMLSFPWIAADYLARIKIKRRGVSDADGSKPINSLGQYLAERMNISLKPSGASVSSDLETFGRTRPLCQS